MSDFHPESWNPMWSVGTILMGLYSFMLEDLPTHGTVYNFNTPYLYLFLNLSLPIRIITD